MIHGGSRSRASVAEKAHVWYRIPNHVWHDGDHNLKHLGPG